MSKALFNTEFIFDGNEGIDTGDCTIPLCVILVSPYQVSEFVTPTTVNGLKYYEIHGRHLEPSTTYVVCVKSYLKWSGRFSDCSAEWEFTTGKCLPLFMQRTVYTEYSCTVS